MSVKRKVWGNTTNLVLTDNLQVELIRVNPKGYCSHHRHENKDNLFWVMKGELRIKLEYQPDAYTMVTMNSTRHPLVIPAKMSHQFVNTTDEPVEAIEMYRSVEGQLVEPDDIYRHSEGGSDWDSENE